VTSLHYHFPWIVLANIRWSVFCAVTRRPMRMNLGWDEYFEIERRAADRPFDERLGLYAEAARRHFDVDRFRDFCDEHLAHLDEVAWEFFGSDEARDAVRQKVRALYPEHEVEEFTEKFWGRIQEWREREGPGAAPGSE
jgi:hypothetical protein